MSAWKDFLVGDVFDPSGKPGNVMVCFLNRFLEGVDGIKYKFVLDGTMGISGLTTEEKYWVEFAPSTFTPIQVYVWSSVNKTYKRLDDVIPRKGRRLLVYKQIDTARVFGTIQKHPKGHKQAPAPDKPAPAAPPGPSPTSNQGTQPGPNNKDENDAPLGPHQRPVPNKITKEQLQKLFTGATLDHLQTIADICNQDLAKYKLDTPFRKAHFFGQVRQESGPGGDLFVENLRYKSNKLKELFSYYKNNPSEADEDGAHLATVDGKKAKVAANEKAIANKVYGTGKIGDELGNTQTGDGWKYRGRGMKQLTGRDNYTNFMKDHRQYFGGTVDFVQSPDLVAVLPYAVHSAIWFWLNNKCYTHADKGINDAAIDAVTKIVNPGEIAKHNAGQYKDPNRNPVLLRRKFVRNAYSAFI